MTELLNRRPHPLTASVPPTYEELCKAMKERTKVTIPQPFPLMPVTGLVNAIEIESGSGDSWFVTIVTSDFQYIKRLLRTS